MDLRRGQDGPSPVLSTSPLLPRTILSLAPAEQGRAAGWRRPLGSAADRVRRPTRLLKRRLAVPDGQKVRRSLAADAVVGQNLFRRGNRLRPRQNQGLRIMAGELDLDKLLVRIPQDFDQMTKVLDRDAVDRLDDPAGRVFVALHQLVRLSLIHI